MSLSNPTNPPIVNEAVAKPASRVLATATDENQTKVNQIHGINPAGSTGAGIPKQVSNVQASLANASPGATSTINIRFQRDPSDKNFAGVVIYVKGYQGNNSPVQVGASKDSPCIVILNNTGESVTLIVQAVGNGGVSPLASSPTTAIKLPKSAGGGAGTTTVTQLVTQPAPSSGPVISDANSVLFWGAGISPSQLVMNGDVINGTPITSTNNLVYVYQFVLPVAMTIRQMVWYLNSGNVGEVFSFGFYNAAKNLIFQVTNTRVGGQNIYVSTFADQTLQPGVYWFAQTCSGTTANGMNATSTSWGGSTFAAFSLRSNGYSGSVQMSGVAANAASAGVLPSSLGAISNAGANVAASPALPMWAS